MNLSVRSPDELLAAIPHLLGFKPEESIVFVPLRSDLPVARVDLPTTAPDRDLVWGSIRDAFSRYARPGSAVAIVCLTADPGSAELASRELSVKLDTIGIDTRLRLWADDAQWSDLDSGQGGVQTDTARDRIAAMTVLTGRAQPATSRETLAAALTGDREPIAQLLPVARAAKGVSTPRAEHAWAAGRLEQFHSDGNRLGDAEAARMLLALESTATRDGLWGDMSRENAGSHVALWTDLTRRAPDEVRAAPASMLGFASWLNGDGARAWCALDEVPTNRTYSMAALVGTALQAGLHPREWEGHRARTGQPDNELDHALRSQLRTSQSAVDRPATGI